MTLFSRGTTTALAAGIAFSFALSAQAQDYRFKIIAGAYDGDGGQALQANLGGPTGIAFDADGNLFVAESSRARIRKIGTDGVIVSVAGTGVPGFTAQPAHAPGDTSALGRINYPQGMVFDRKGNLYFAEQGNNRIRVLRRDGSIALVAGNGSSAFSGDGGPAIDAGIGSPYGLALDFSGNLYFSDYKNHRVRKVSTGGVITTVAGTGVMESTGDGGPATQAGLAQPLGIAIDQLNHLLIAETGTGRIRKVAGGQISTLAAFDGVNDVASDANGNVYVSQTCGIDKVDANGAIQPFFVDPHCHTFAEKPVISSDGTVFFADSANGYVYRKGSGDAQPVIVAGRGSDFGDGGPALSASLSGVTGVGLDGAGGLCLADARWNLKIRKIGADGKIATLAGNGYYDGPEPDGIPAVQASFDRPEDCKVDAFGNVYIADGIYRVLKVTTDGKIHRLAGANGLAGFQGDGGPAKDALLKRPSRVVVDAAGNVFIADKLNNRIRKVDSSGIISTVAGNGVNAHAGDGGLATEASLAAPSAVAVDAVGNLYIAETGRVRKVNAAGVIATIAGNGQTAHTGDGGLATNAGIGTPRGIAVADNGDLFVAAGALRKVSAATGLISTLSRLAYPANDVAVGGDGALYVADGGGRVLKGVPEAASAKARKP